MTISKFNFAAACLLLGTSGLLISCGGGAAVVPESKPTSEELSAGTADCTLDELKEPEIRPSTSTSHDKPRKEGSEELQEEYADCIAVPN